MQEFTKGQKVVVEEAGRLPAIGEFRRMVEESMDSQAVVMILGVRHDVHVHWITHYDFEKHSHLYIMPQQPTVPPSPRPNPDCDYCKAATHALEIARQTDAMALKKIRELVPENTRLRRLLKDFRSFEFQRGCAHRRDLEWCMCMDCIRDRADAELNPGKAEPGEPPC